MYNTDGTVTIRGRRYSMEDLTQIWSERNAAGDGFLDDGLRSTDVPIWQEVSDDKVSVIQRGLDVLLIDSKGWAVHL